MDFAEARISRMGGLIGTTEVVPCYKTGVFEGFSAACEVLRWSAALSSLFPACISHGPRAPRLWLGKNPYVFAVFFHPICHNKEGSKSGQAEPGSAWAEPGQQRNWLLRSVPFRKPKPAFFGTFNLCASASIHPLFSNLHCK